MRRNPMKKAIRMRRGIMAGVRSRRATLMLGMAEGAVLGAIVLAIWNVLAGDYMRAILAILAGILTLLAACNYWARQAQTRVPPRHPRRIQAADNTAEG